MKYILLSPVTPADFILKTFDEVKEAADEFGCQLLLSTKVDGTTIGYFVSDKKETLENMCTEVNLEGTVLEYTSVYDQLVQLL
jgi:hypothetical protein